MIPSIEDELNVRSMAVLEKIEAAALFADYHAQARQLIRSYKNHRLRSQANRRAELDNFQKSSDGIRRTKRGWSASSERELKATSYDEREQARKARNKRDQRARKAKPVIAPLPVTAPVVITRKAFHDRLRRLKVWLTLPGHRQRHLHGREAEIIRSWIVYQAHISRHGRKPSLSVFARAFVARFDMPMSRPMAQNRLRLLETLMEPGGPMR